MRGDIALTLTGLVAMFATFGLLWARLPDGSNPAPPADVNSRPFATAAFCAALMLACAMLYAGLLGSFGSR
jgi:hypothetical protein